MSQLIKLEKRFENALEKLEKAFTNKQVGEVLESSDGEEENIKENDHDIDALLIKIDQLEKAAKHDADEIEELVRKLKMILGTVND